MNEAPLLPAARSPALPSTPWYRCVWPWALMAGPAFVIVAGAYTTWLAVSTSDGLVADDYYKRGLAINRTLARGDESARIGLSATIRIDAAGDVRASLRAAGDDGRPAAVKLVLAHPTRAGQDRATTLQRIAGDEYAGHVDAPGTGRRHVIVETERWRLSGDVTLGASSEVRLDAPKRDAE